MEDRAKFIGYQECPGHAPLALYNVLDKAHRLYGSTVSAATLAREKIPVPETPKYYDPDQLAMGIKVEAEHLGTLDIAFTKTAEFIDKHAGIQARIKDIIRADKKDSAEYDKLLLDTATAIAKDHLDELPDYYTRLAKMESEAGVKKTPVIDAGEVLTLSLLRRINNNAYSHKQRGVLSIPNGIVRKTFDNQEARTVVEIPAEGIKGNKDLFLRDFAKTLNAQYFKIKIIPSLTKQNPDTMERDQIVAEYERQGIETLHGKGGFWKRDKESQKSLGFVTLAKARKETGIDLHKTRGPAMSAPSWDYAIIQMLNQPRRNPANKSYKGDTDVKAIGNIPAPRPGMMMVVNPSGPRRTKETYEAELNEIFRGEGYRPEWEYLVIKSKQPGKTRQLLEHGMYGTVLRKHDPIAFQVGFRDWVREKENPALLVLNPSKLQRWHDRLDRHYKTLERLAANVGLKNADGKKLSVALLKLENQAHKATTDYANGDIDEAQMDKIDSEVTSKVFKLFGKLLGFFVNRDPRGYALKIDNKFMPRYEKVGLERDWGGYGILSPEISKENPAKVPCRYCGRPSEDKSGVCLVCANKYEKKNPVYQYRVYDVVNGKRKQIDSVFYNTNEPAEDVKESLINHDGYSPSISVIKTREILGAKKNPMVKDMTSYRQKQQIKADVKRMAGLPQRRPHPEFATLELAAEYVEKTLGKVTSIIQGKSSYVIRHAKGIAAFSTTKNNKLIML